MDKLDVVAQNPMLEFLNSEFRSKMIKISVLLPTAQLGLHGTLCDSINVKLTWPGTA